jgi:hypothetical protein
MIRHKMIYDPAYETKLRSLRDRNKMGITVGFDWSGFHLWNCRTTDFDLGFFWATPPLPDSIKARRHEMALAHARCRWPHRHLSDIPTIYLYGPRRRYHLRLLGRKYAEDKIFGWHDHGRYWRWLDNGPQSKPLPEMPERDSAAIAAMREYHRETARKVKAEMDEWRETH